jgi:hypothetical protein
MRKWWAHKGSNLGPLPCEGKAIPLDPSLLNGGGYAKLGFWLTDKEILQTLSVDRLAFD